MKYDIYIQDSAVDDIRELEGELSEGHLNAGIRKDDRRSQHRGCHQNGARAGSWSQFRGTGLRYCYRRGVRDRATPSISSMGILDFLAGLSARTPEPQMKYLLDRQTNDDQDRELMLRTLGQACAKTGWRVQGLGTDEQSLPLVNGDASTQFGRRDEMGTKYLYPSIQSSP
jgi:hypothetical protein